MLGVVPSSTSIQKLILPEEFAAKKKRVVMENKFNLISQM